tara:strand:+ start:1494 stop:1835 length:342 start_codon:yes stop_codon:yes gene_type:complete
MNKRGQGEAQQLFLLFEIILGITVASIFIFSTINFDSMSNTEKIFIEKDLNLMAPTLLAAPGEIEYNYPIKDLYQVESADPFQLTKTESFIALDHYNITLYKAYSSTNLQVAS